MWQWAITVDLVHLYKILFGNIRTKILGILGTSNFRHLPHLYTSYSPIEPNLDT